MAAAWAMLARTAAWCSSGVGGSASVRGIWKAAALPAKHVRTMATGPLALERTRNIGISAHIDSGKTTLTERVLFYTGRIRDIHEVRGKDGVGAKMDSMELEREKGITIQSAATYCSWKDYHVNIIDTPGHVDFTIEVERALRVLDGAVLVLCGVGGVQSQSITVDRQMKRYNVPRICFINKLDRSGADPWRVISDLRSKLGHNAAAVHVPIGEESDLEGVVDVIKKKAIYFEGEFGEKVVERDIPADLAGIVDQKRLELIEAVSDVDEELAEMFLMEESPNEEQLRAAVRRATIALNFTPVFLGSALKNCGVQTMLDGVIDFLPNPTEISTHALDFDNHEAKVPLESDPDKDLVALAFKLEESRFGQLTYMRVYQGSLRRGEFISNSSTGKRIKTPRLVRMHSDEMEDIDVCGPGDIVAMFGVECSSGDTFISGDRRLGLSSMFVPQPVMSLAVEPKAKTMSASFSKALNRFMREDPTFRVEYDDELKQTIISGMGELHLDIYIERMRREYKLDVVVGQPRVNYIETVSARGAFDYTHKKQSGGAGQYGRVVGYIEPIRPIDQLGENEGMETVEEGEALDFQFENNIVGNAIPPNFIPACEKGFREASTKGPLIGQRVENVRVVLTDGQAHVVDSSEMAFKLASGYALTQAVRGASGVILEPLMSLQVEAPEEFQGAIVAGLNRRRGLIQNTEQRDMYVHITADIPLANMFGYSTDLRSITQGKGEFTMEYRKHAPVTRDVQEELVKEFEKKRREGK